MKLARLPLATLTAGLALLIRAPESAGADRLDEIRQAIRQGDRAAVVQWLGTGASPDLRDKHGNTPLIDAAHLGDRATVQWLLNAGADPNATNAAGVAPLHRAATDPEKVSLLLAHGARVNTPTAFGNTPLLLAARAPKAFESVRLLIEKGADVHATNLFGSTALMAAAAAGQLETVKLLIERGADVNAAPLMEVPDSDPIWGGLRTPLMWAALRGNRDVVAYLIDHGANVNAVTGFGTALSQAAWFGHPDVAELLMTRGAKVDLLEPFSGLTPLHWAASAEDSRTRMVELLLEQGADPKAEGGQPVDAFMAEPQTPLMFALKRGDTPVVRSLVKAGALIPDLSAKPIGSSATRDAITSGPSVAAAIGRAIPPLQKTAIASREAFLRHATRQNCVSCHQQYLPMTAVGLARDRKAPMDPIAAARLTEMVLASHLQSELNAQALLHPEPAYDNGYALLALRADGTTNPEATDLMVLHLAAIQNEDGHWDVNLARPPIQASEFAATALGTHGLSHFGWPARAAEFAANIGRAREWLSTHRPVTHEDRVFQLLGLKWAGESTASLASQAQPLIAQQRNDGGWAQLPGLDSDAYATGTALYALRVAADLKADHPAVRRGVQFLLTTQGADGTWHVKRRAFPFQPTMDSGFAHGRDSWISAAGSSWAVMALASLTDPGVDLTREFAQAIEKTSTHREASTRAPMRAAREEGLTQAALTVDFARDIKPLLERSCLDCHSGERPRSNYRLTSRESLLAPGNLGLPPVIPGRSADSPLLSYIADRVADLEMPPVGKRAKYAAFTADEIGRLRAWIDQGAPWPAGADAQ
jgi:N-acyl-D-amino-acid deacylase